jgi:kinesin family protein C2/C3
VDLAEHEANSHVIATLKIASTNTSTGIGSTGKIQFVDLAGSNVTQRRPTGAPKKASTPEAMFAGVGNNKEWKFINKSMTTLSEVVYARSQYSRSVPYRNSTLTHLLSDSLEADTKVVMVACISSDLKDLQETACTLRFAQKMRKIIVGKATKHILTHA